MSGGKRNERDEFWDIESLIPKTKTNAPVRHPASVEAVEISSDAPTEFGSDGSGRLTVTRGSLPKKSNTVREEPEGVFEYTGGPLHRVRVFAWKTNYTYFEQFRIDGLNLLRLHGSPCEHEKFFSYIPQYSQLSAGQLKWYLYMRERIRGGEYPETDFSYIMLYVYELINLSDKIKPEYVLEQLFGILENYRFEHTHITQYLAEWICDFSLIHGLHVPESLSSELCDELMMHTSLKEFYVSSPDARKSDGQYSKTLIRYCSNYDYTKSKYYTEENKNTFDKYIVGAVGCAAECMAKNQRMIEDTTAVRDTFVGALCSHFVKKRIEVEYTSFFRSHEIRFAVTDTVKYTENRIRAAIGVKSKLSYQKLPEDIMQTVNAYLDTELPKLHPKPKQPEAPAYERLYDLPKDALSVSRAADIERESWQTTEKLIDAFGDGEYTEAEVSEPESEVKTAENPSGFAKYAEFIRAALIGDFAAQSSAASKLGKMPDSVADEINTLCADGEIGDIILEKSGRGYTVIEEYVEDVKSLLEGEING